MKRFIGIFLLVFTLTLAFAQEAFPQNPETTQTLGFSEESPGVWAISHPEIAVVCKKQEIRKATLFIITADRVKNGGVNMQYYQLYWRFYYNEVDKIYYLQLNNINISGSFAKMKSILSSYMQVEEQGQEILE